MVSVLVSVSVKLLLTPSVEVQVYGMSTSGPDGWNRQEQALPLPARIVMNNNDPLNIVAENQQEKELTTVTTPSTNVTNNTLSLIDQSVTAVTNNNVKSGAKNLGGQFTTSITDSLTTTGGTGSSLITPNTVEKFHISSGLHVDDSIIDKVVTMDDVLNSTKEGEDEANIIRRIEKVSSNRYISKQSLFPIIDDNFVDNFDFYDNKQNDETYSDDDDNSNSSSSLINSNISNDSNLSHLTRRLRQFHSYKNYDASHRSRQNIHNSSTFDPTTTKTDAERYHNNAANMYITGKRPSCNSIETTKGRIYSADLESGSNNERTNDGDEKEDGDIIKDVKRGGGNNFVRNIRSYGMRKKADLEYFKEFLEPHRKTLWSRFVTLFLYIMVPSFLMAVILFYGFQNPPTGVALELCSDLEPMDKVEEESDLINEYYYQPVRYKQVSLSPTNFPTNAPSLSLSPSSVPTIHQPSMTVSPTTSPTRKPTYTFSDAKNATTCYSERKSLEKPSVSWWFLFIGVRQVVTFCLAVLTQLIVIDFLTFRTRFFPRILGTNLALGVGQSKGWPFILFFWVMYDLTLLFGNRDLARHWLHQQRKVDMMWGMNPSGNFTDNPLYKRFLYFSIILSVAATIKRTVMANFVGQRVVAYYRYDLSKIIKKLLTVSDVAELSNVTKSAAPADDKRKSIFQRLSSVGRMVADGLEVESDSDNYEEDAPRPPNEFKSIKPMRMKSMIAKSSGAMNTSMNSSEIFMSAIYENLDEWEEPELQNEYQEAVSTTDVLHFRRAVKFINSDHPFSPAFGKATSREETALLSQNMYQKLLPRRREVLHFQDICKIAENGNGVKDKKKVLELVRLFRPNREGVITKLEFVKSIDSVYKELKLILANINSSSQIDRAYGQIANLLFFISGTVVGLWSLSVDIKTLVIGISGLLVSFAFMIGSSASKYLEGILLILVRRPYDIGDRVCFLDPNADTDNIGPSSGGWIVEGVDLYTTTVRLGTTREYATFSNASLSNSRILNLRRSEKPNVYMYFKFTMNVSQQQLDEFRRRIIQFIKDRPREWSKVVSLRCTHVETELQYLKYVFIVQHRESWQSFSTIQVSKGDIHIHALYLQKELNMEYTAPKLPIQLSGGGFNNPSLKPFRECNVDKSNKLDDGRKFNMSGLQSGQFTTGTTTSMDPGDRSRNSTTSERSNVTFSDSVKKSKFV